MLCKDCLIQTKTTCILDVSCQALKGWLYSYVDPESKSAGTAPSLKLNGSRMRCNCKSKQEICGPADFQYEHD